MYQDKIKREASIILASRTNSDDLNYNIVLGLLEKVYSVIDDNDLTLKERNVLFEYFNKIHNTGILSPLTLQDDEFEVDEDGVLLNKRFPYIYKDNESYYNTLAFNCYVRKEYDFYTKKEIPSTHPILNQQPVYIAKGGVLSGDYIFECEIRPNVVAEHNFTIQSTVKLPVSSVNKDNHRILFVDAREPKLKILQQFYNLEIWNMEDDEIIGLDIRKYKKL